MMELHNIINEVDLKKNETYQASKASYHFTGNTEKHHSHTTRMQSAKFNLEEML